MDLLKGELIWVNTNGKQFSKVDFDDIIYVKGLDKKSELFTTNNSKLIILHSLSSVQKMLNSKRFYRVHKSYIVNLDYVDSIYKKTSEILMRNLDSIPLPKSKKASFEKLFVDYFQKGIHNNINPIIIELDGYDCKAKVDLSEIYYFKAKGKKSTVYDQSKTVIEIDHMIGELEHMLTNRRFFRCNRSYLVNLNLVIHFNTSKPEVTLANGEQIPVSNERKEDMMRILGFR